MSLNLHKSDAFTLEDIRKIRNDRAERFTDKDGKIDWAGLKAETEEKAGRVRTEIARLRAERVAVH